MPAACKVNEALKPLLVPIESLTPDPTNARVHSDRNIDAIAYSLKTYGQQKPISISPDGTTVLAGNGTLLAALKLGWGKIAAVPFDSEEAVKQAGWKIADNRTAELAAWDWEIVAVQLSALRADGQDLAALGWDEAELAPLLNADWEPPAKGELPDKDEARVAAIHLASPDQRAKIERAVKHYCLREATQYEEGEAVARICDEWMRAQGS